MQVLDYVLDCTYRPDDLEDEDHKPDTGQPNLLPLPIPPSRPLSTAQPMFQPQPIGHRFRIYPLTLERANPHTVPGPLGAIMSRHDKAPPPSEVDLSGERPLTIGACWIEASTHWIETSSRWG
jgi:hypothetical protein